MAARNHTYDAVIDSPLGRLGVTLADGALVDVDFATARTPLKTAADPVARRVCRQLQNYFSDPGISFQLPLAPRGTPFQQKVWQALQDIPAGEVRTYGELAATLGSGARAVGGACRANPIPIIIPCHRVVSRAGLGGYMGRTAGQRLAIKDWLLRHEQ